MTWIERLEKYVKALQTAKFPKDSICTHHGIGVARPGIQARIGIAPGTCSFRSHKAGMLFTIYGDRGFSKKTFKRWREGLSKFGKIADEWNGLPGSDGISIVIDMPAPKLFMQAINNYHNLDSPFKLSDEENARFKAFDDALDEALKKQGIRL